MTGAQSPLLQVGQVTKSFGALVAVNDLTFDVGEGEVLGIMGPNGAGKSTLFNLIMGAMPLSDGAINFAGQKIDGLQANQICSMGIGRTYQIPQPFRHMTVVENVVVGLLYGQHKSAMEPAHERALEILETVRLADKAELMAGQLGLLDLKRLEMARALSTNPRLLLLDEIAGGLVESEVEELEQNIDDLKSHGQSMIIIEHVIRTLFNHSDRILVMNFGTEVAIDTPPKIAENEEVIDIYLGEELDEKKVVSTVQIPVEERDTILAVSNISAGYGEFQALFDVSLEIRKGEIVALIGINGAGKSTLTRAVTNQIPLTAGGVTWQGEDLAKYQAYDIVDLGISQCLEGRKIFNHMTVLENLEIGAYPTHAREKRFETLKWIYELFPRLEERADQLGGTLSGGEQQMLAIGRALMALPELIIFDEISLGLAPKIIDDIYEIIPIIVEHGTTVLLIEQNVHRSLGIADRAYILERGRVTLTGSAQELIENKEIQEAYFGLETA
ncbi:MAG: ATP-binding cassette domain-containing protein [Rhodospirillaceae bacterium]|nr:ATP-binding cassette domain-containing protein [Rhodospirillaceae bacterium]